jgi:hypothetical protein
MSIEEPYLQRVQSQLSGYPDARHSQALLSCLPHSRSLRQPDRNRSLR